MLRIASEGSSRETKIRELIHLASGANFEIIILSLVSYGNLRHTFFERSKPNLFREQDWVPGRTQGRARIGIHTLPLGSRDSQDRLLISSVKIVLAFPGHTELH